MKRSILFCGTPLFAVASLISLFKHQDNLNYILKGVVTTPDRKSGRGHKMQESAVKKEAKKLGLKIFTPDNLNNSKFISDIKHLKLDLIVVVAFKKLPKILFKLPTIGTINLHASLLPKYRGAAPINWVIVNGEKQTGLTTFFINEKIDTGDILFQTKVIIHDSWHANDLHDILMKKSHGIIQNTLKNVLSGVYDRKKQDKASNNQYARKIQKADFIINADFWKTHTIQAGYNFMKGMSPPGVKITILLNKHKKNIIIIRVSDLKKIKNKIEKKEPYIDISNKNQITITDGISSFHIKKLKVENSKEMLVKDFYNGFIKSQQNMEKIVML